MISIVGLAAFVAGLSVAIYTHLPASMWEGAARHGRYAGLGSGNARAPGREATRARSWLAQ
jgi:hypothetical protein